MRTREFTLALLLPASLVLAGACAGNDDSAAPIADAGSPDAFVELPADAGADADADASVTTGCAGEWCAIELAGLGNVSLSAIWGSGPSDVWVVGSRGFAAHFDGAAWQVRQIDTLLTIYSLWGSGPNDVWAANSGSAVFHWDGAAWKMSRVDEGDDPRAVLALGGVGTTDVFALLEANDAFGGTCPGPWGDSYVSCPSVYRFSTINGESAWRKASDDAYVCKNLYVDNQYCVGLSGLWVDPAGQPWTVGNGGRAIRAHGTPTPPGIAGAVDETHSASALEGISGTSTDDVWTVGAAGTIRHFTGGVWTSVSSPTNAHLRAVWARSSIEAWAVGAGGVIIRWDGSRWQRSPSPLDEAPRELRGVWGDPSGTTWTVGDRTLLVRRPNPTSNP
jgi:hypothetical protein